VPQPENEPADDPDFEDIVAALLKVDPEGIIKPKKGKAKTEDASGEEGRGAD